jgi:hypothetical protein
MKLHGEVHGTARDGLDLPVSKARRMPALRAARIVAGLDA